MRSLYKRQLTMMVGVMVLSFTLLSTAFMLLSYRYIISEKRDAMARNASYIATFTASYYQQYDSIQDKIYSNYVASIARISDSYVIVTTPGGEIIYATDGDHLYDYKNTCLPKAVVDQVLHDGDYTGMTNLDGIYPERRYMAALPVSAMTLSGRTVVEGLVLVSADASSLAEMWSAMATIFFFSAVVVLIISVIASTITSAHQARPLNEMAEAARKFGRGEFDVRVTGYEGRCDEISTLAESFNTMASSLAKVESQRSDFIANISHELKTPMTTISGFAEGILDGTIPPERERDSLQIIVSETRRLSRLVRRMLDVSQLQAIDPLRNGNHFDVCESMRRVLISMEKKINDRHLDVEADIPDEPILVLGDNDMITQVIYNLLENAAKFAREGSTLYLGVAMMDGKARITVRNVGETIPAEELPLLFERFHKSDKSRSEDKDGYGLGLYIVKTILQQHKEEINVTSENGVTTFTFSLRVE